METLKAFYEKVKSDENLQREIKNLSENNDKDGFIELAKLNGVSDNGIKIMMDVSFKVSESDSLSDKELEAIAGGEWVTSSICAGWGWHC